ncbi:homeobox-leucine zipper HAT4 [Olea europaea subsp. europaea]|uniref:Homeobox-leucine zipper HAT4 n=1 Tax=Olea europaea subsp. europaea TaxID=158383 RepID=A0A8S0R3W9_OLEEU|nr:homeobox-leucine zipper HAT4 [Olea europaea subsp. europaea]
MFGQEDWRRSVHYIVHSVYQKCNSAVAHLHLPQVEVLFQNRRTRTKLKQTELSYVHLKKWCETLTEENRRLQKEFQELRGLKVFPTFPRAVSYYYPFNVSLL